MLARIVLDSESITKLNSKRLIMHIQTKILSPKLFIDNTAFKMLGNTELTNKQNTVYVRF